MFYDPFDSDVIAAGGEKGFAELGCGGGAVREYVSLDDEEEFSISPAIPALAICAFVGRKRSCFWSL